MNVQKKTEYHLVSFSGGKDSTAMLLRMLELGMKIDEVLNCDTQMEFPQMYQHIESVKNIVESKGIKFVTLRNSLSFKYLMLEHQVKRKVAISGNPKGYSWAGSRSRWCTAKLKTDLLRRYKRELQDQYTVIEYVGIAADEQYRLERENNKQHKHPLVDWGWTEADALKYCYDKGFDFGGLYELFDRVSCWCYPLQGLDELYNLRKFFPDLWKELLALDSRTWRKFRPDYSVAELEIMFSLQDELVQNGKFEGRRKQSFRKLFKERLGDSDEREDKT